MAPKYWIISKSDWTLHISTSSNFWMGWNSITKQASFSFVFIIRSLLKVGGNDEFRIWSTGSTLCANIDWILVGSTL